jgi:hypothetical protein
MSDPVNTQVLNALAKLLNAASTGASGVHVSRGESDPFESDELPAINLVMLDEDIATPTVIGSGVGVQRLQVHTLRLVVQVVARSTVDAENDAREISAKCAKAIAADPLLGGVCSQLLYPVAQQWLRDEGSEQRLARQNTLYRGEYRTYSNDPFTPV